SSPGALHLRSFPTRRSSDLKGKELPHRAKRRALRAGLSRIPRVYHARIPRARPALIPRNGWAAHGEAEASGEASGASKGWETSRSEEHTSELQSRENLVCRL